MTRRIALAVVTAAVLCSPALAQEYSFSVPEMELHVTVNPDASVKMEYRIEFDCNQGAHAIDIVDVGLPHANYDISNMSAALDGKPLETSISPSEYVTPGVEVPLFPPIEGGHSGVFEFQCTMPDLVWQDTTRADYASLRITPTWFGSQYVTGETDLSIAIYLPDDLQLDEILYHKKEFTIKAPMAGKKMVAWLFEDTRADHEHMVGVSFPKRVMDRVVHISKLGLLWKWWEESAGARVFVGLVCLVLFGIWFYRVSAGTGSCIFIPLVILLIILWSASAALEALFIPLLIMLWLIVGRVRAARQRSYLPAIASVPGGGIKRGLAVPEAAVILEEPLGRVLTLVIFGLLKKKLVTLANDDPLTVNLVEGYEVPRKERRRLARERGTTIRGFEQPFLEVIAKNPDTPVQDLDLSNAMKNLVQTSAKRMEGFDLERTREYYRSIMAKAWEEARQIGDVSKRTDYVDNNLGWLMLHDDAPVYFSTWERGGYHYSPRWGQSGPVGVGGAAPSGPAVGGRTSLGDVAASFAGWSENVAGRMASTMDPISIGVVDAPSINLSGVDKVGVDFLKSVAESSSSGGGGGGGGCACACAGCACACACAGGGR